MSGLRRFLAEQIQPRKVEQVSASRLLAEYSAGMRQFEADKKASEEAAALEAAKPKPQSLVEELRFELEAHNAGNDTPGLNDQRILELAAGAQEASRSVREELSGLLRGMWDKRESGHG
jgi:hypothetical protein